MKFSDRILGSLFRDRGLDPVWARRSPQPETHGGEFTRCDPISGAFTALAGRRLAGPEKPSGRVGEIDGFTLALPKGGAPEILHDIPASELKWGVPAGDWRGESSCLPSERKMQERFDGR